MHKNVSENIHKALNCGVRGYGGATDGMTEVGEKSVSFHFLVFCMV